MAGRILQSRLNPDQLHNIVEIDNTGQLYRSRNSGHFVKVLSIKPPGFSSPFSLFLMQYEDIDVQVQAIDLVPDSKTRGCVDVTAFLVSAHMRVAMIVATVRQAIRCRVIEVHDDQEEVLAN